ncbi:phage minor head protein [Planococcus dechangensis]|uniref:Phage minor head protein n=1 Tax=Planococcus dechangensis TaxID=1176255 RepID=A0ABV9M8V0_9BACL
MSRKESERMNRALDKSLSSYEKELTQAYNESLKNIRGQIAELYAKSDGNFAESIKYNRLASLEKQIGQEIKELTGKTAKTLDRGIVSQFEETRLREMFVIEKDIQATADFAMLNKSQVREAINNHYDRIGFINRNEDNAAKLVAQIKQEISQGLIQGKSFQDTARSVRDRMEIGGGDALRIVRTESKKARGVAKQSTQEEAQDMGIKIQKQWVAAVDDRTRDSHASADGQIVELDEQFDVDGEMMDHPGDPAASAENVINCRCTTISVVGGYAPTSRRIRGEGTVIEGKNGEPDKIMPVDYTTFDKWKESRA